MRVLEKCENVVVNIVDIITNLPKILDWKELVLLVFIICCFALFVHLTKPIDSLKNYLKEKKASDQIDEALHMLDGRDSFIHNDEHVRVCVDKDSLIALMNYPKDELFDGIILDCSKMVPHKVIYWD